MHRGGLDEPLVTLQKNGLCRSSRVTNGQRDADDLIINLLGPRTAAHARPRTLLYTTPLAVLAVCCCVSRSASDSLRSVSVSLCFDPCSQRDSPRLFSMFLSLKDSLFSVCLSKILRITSNILIKVHKLSFFYFLYMGICQYLS